MSTSCTYFVFSHLVVAHSHRSLAKYLFLKCGEYLIHIDLVERFEVGIDLIIAGRTTHPCHPLGHIRRWTVTGIRVDRFLEINWPAGYHHSFVHQRDVEMVVFQRMMQTHLEHVLAVIQIVDDRIGRYRSIVCGFPDQDLQREGVIINRPIHVDTEKKTFSQESSVFAVNLSSNKEIL